MPRFKTYPSSFVKAHGGLRSIDRRRGVFPRRPGSLEQGNKSDMKPDKKTSEKRLFRKYNVQPWFDGRTEKEQDRLNAGFRLYWRKGKRGLVRKTLRQQTEPLSSRLRFNSVREPGGSSTQNGSRTSEWLSLFASEGTVVPKRLSRIEFPAGDVAIPTPPVPRKRRTNQEKANVEAVLITPIPLMRDYLSAEMIDTIRTSPFCDPGLDVVTLRSQAHRTRGQNVLECFNLLTKLIRNVANEIVYREQRIVAEERMYREEGAYDDPE